MESIFGNSDESIAEVQQLIKREIPVYRQAYSDRTAWVMSCLSELVYIQFNPLFPSENAKNLLLESMSKMVGDQKIHSLLRFIDLFGYDHSKELEKLKHEVSSLQYKLVETFDECGTQAILVSNGKFMVLAFRGTEATSIKDIKADTKANTIACETGGKIHSGFSDAYDYVALSILEKLKDPNLIHLPLFITGHSLGGAIATVAAKKLTHQGGIAACYTFGAPRVGDEQWISQIKTPIYRLVNAADCVTMLPPGDETVSLMGWICQFIPGFGGSLRKWLLANLDGYLHAGNMRYLTNCKKGEYRQTKLLYSVSFWYRMKGFFVKKMPWKVLLADHSISVYRKKLWVIAQRNNVN